MEASRSQQEPMIIPEPQREHKWLEKLIGEWTIEGEASMEPGKPPEKYEGTLNVRSLGGLWILAECEGDMPCVGPATTLMTLGYNPQKSRFVGTFMGSMMTHLWIYDGSLDAERRVLTLDTEGPSMTDETKMAKFQDIVEFKNDDHWVLRSQVLGDGGNWHEFMMADYKRRK